MDCNLDVVPNEHCDVDSLGTRNVADLNLYENKNFRKIVDRHIKIKMEKEFHCTEA